MKSAGGEFEREREEGGREQEERERPHAPKPSTLNPLKPLPAPVQVIRTFVERHGELKEVCMHAWSAAAGAGG